MNDRTPGIHKQWLRMFEDWLPQFSGGPQWLNLAKRNPRCKGRVLTLLYDLATEMQGDLPLLERGPRFTVELGQFKTPDDLIVVLNAAGVRFGGGDDSVVSLLRRIDLCQESRLAEGYVVTPGDTGNIQPVPQDRFYRETEELGFGDVVQEFTALVAFECALKLKWYGDCGLEVPEYYVAGSKPIVGADGIPRTLYVKLEREGVYLSATGNPDRVFHYEQYLRSKTCKN